MNTDYVSLETAKLLKEAGYNTKHEIILFGGKKEVFETNNISLWYAQKWLRELHKIHIEIGLENYTDGYIWGYQILSIGNDHSINKYDGEYKTYEQALDTAIQEACKLIINGKI